MQRKLISTYHERNTTCYRTPLCHKLCARSRFKAYHQCLRGSTKESKLFFTEDEAPRRASNHGPLHGNYEKNSYSQQETDNYTQTLDEKKIKAWNTPKNELDLSISINEFSKTDQCLRGFLSVDFYDFGMVRTLTGRRIRFW